MGIYGKGASPLKGARLSPQKCADGSSYRDQRHSRSFPLASVRCCPCFPVYSRSIPAALRWYGTWYGTVRVRGDTVIRYGTGGLFRPRRTYQSECLFMDHSPAIGILTNEAFSFKLCAKVIQVGPALQTDTGVSRLGVPFFDRHASASC
jgi:hypothetical protein